jgi:hypothetical protein
MRRRRRFRQRQRESLLLPPRVGGRFAAQRFDVTVSMFTVP